MCTRTCTRTRTRTRTCTPILCQVLLDDFQTEKPRLELHHVYMKQDDETDGGYTTQQSAIVDSPASHSSESATEAEPVGTGAMDLFFSLGRRVPRARTAMARGCHSETSRDEAIRQVAFAICATASAFAVGILRKFL